MIDALSSKDSIMCCWRYHEDDDADSHEEVILMMMGLRICQNQSQEPGGEEASWCCIMTVLQQSILGRKWQQRRKNWHDLERDEPWTKILLLYSTQYPFKGWQQIQSTFESAIWPWMKIYTSCERLSSERRIYYISGLICSYWINPSLLEKLLVFDIILYILKFSWLWFDDSVWVTV